MIFRNLNRYNTCIRNNDFEWLVKKGLAKKCRFSFSHKSSDEKAIPQIIDMEDMQSVSAQLGSSFVPSIFYFTL